MSSTTYWVEETKPRRPLGPLPCDFGKFELQELVGVGGMGRVYRAWQKDLRRTLAIKLLEVGSGRPTRGLTVRERQDLAVEARAAGRLAHPNIVTVHEVGSVDGEDYIAMEFVDGPSLKDYLRVVWLTREHGRRFVRGRLPSLLMHMAELAAALEYAHSVGVMHRDIKPGNILVRLEEAVVEDQAPPEIKRMKLADFGLAIDLELGTDAAEAHKLIGTPGYLSPEQARGKGDRWMPPSDVFSMGAVMYELLTGVAPFLRDTPEESLWAVRFDEPGPPSRLNPDLDPAIDRIVLSCLVKEPWDRCACARDLAAAIVDYLRRESEDDFVVLEIVEPSAPPPGVQEDVKARLERGKARAESGDVGRALADFSQILQVRPDHVEARVRRALLLLAVGDLKWAIEDATLAGTNPEALRIRALAHRQDHRDAEALADYERALKTAPAEWGHRTGVEQAIARLRQS